MILSEVTAIFLDLIDDDSQRVTTDAKLTRYLGQAFKSVYNRLVKFHPYLIEQTSTVVPVAGAFTLASVGANQILEARLNTYILNQVRSGSSNNTSTSPIQIRFIPTITFPVSDATEFDFNTSDVNLEDILGELVALEAASLSAIKDNELPPAIVARTAYCYSQLSSTYSFYEPPSTYSTNLLSDTTYYSYSTGAYTLSGGTFQLVNVGLVGLVPRG